jgi:hypothetical protein
MASGRPSRRWQILATAPMVGSVTAKPGTTCPARWANKLTAGNRISSAAVSCRPGSGAASGATGTTVSASMFSDSRLVATTRSPPAARSSMSVSLATASTRCSQLSSTSSSCRSATWSASAVSGAACAWRPRPPATASATSISSRSWSSWTSHTPSRNARREPAATRNASLVLPTPPTPVSVTRRHPDSSRLTSATSSRRPTKLVSSAGILPAARPPAAITIQRYAGGLRI